MARAKTPYRFGRAVVFGAAAMVLFTGLVFAAERPWYKDTDGYKDGLIVWLKMGDTEEAYQKEYVRQNWPDGNVPTSRLDYGIDKMGRAAEGLGRIIQREFFLMTGLDPNVPIKQQFGRTEQIYDPVKGYDKLKPETVQFYMTYMFKNTLDSVRAVEVAARAIAQTAVRLCDENLRNQALADMRFVLKVYQERLAHARDIDEMNEHQLNFLNSELGYLMDPRQDPRYVLGWILVKPWHARNTLDSYLGITVSRRMILETGRVPEEILDAVHVRREAIRILGEKTAIVKNYLSAGIKTLEENIRQIETAFKKDACVQCR
jgi:hypothetical protein